MTIAEVSKRYDISPDTLRYYERVGVLPAVPRSKSGIRDYDENACAWVELMKCMRSAGVSIDALVEYARLYQQGNETLQARRDLLAQQRRLLAQKLAEIQTSIDRLDYKIRLYDEGKMVRPETQPPVPSAAE